jgi:hypothetical protein
VGERYVKLLYVLLGEGGDDPNGTRFTHSHFRAQKVLISRALPKMPLVMDLDRLKIHKKWFYGQYTKKESEFFFVESIFTEIWPVFS